MESGCGCRPRDPSRTISSTNSGSWMGSCQMGPPSWRHTSDQHTATPRREILQQPTACLDVTTPTRHLAVTTQPTEACVWWRHYPLLLLSAMWFAHASPRQRLPHLEITATLGTLLGHDWAPGRHRPMGPLGLGLGPDRQWLQMKRLAPGTLHSADSGTEDAPNASKLRAKRHGITHRQNREPQTW